MTVHVWIDYSYYDGLLTFARGCATIPGVVWLGNELPVIEPTRAATGDNE